MSILVKDCQRAFLMIKGCSLVDPQGQQEGLISSFQRFVEEKIFSRLHSHRKGIEKRFIKPLGKKWRANIRYGKLARYPERVKLVERAWNYYNQRIRDVKAIRFDLSTSINTCSQKTCSADAFAALRPMFISTMTEAAYITDRFIQARHLDDVSDNVDISRHFKLREKVSWWIASFEALKNSVKKKGLEIGDLAQGYQKRLKVFQQRCDEIAKSYEERRDWFELCKAHLLRSGRRLKASRGLSLPTWVSVAWKASNSPSPLSKSCQRVRDSLFGKILLHATPADRQQLERHIQQQLGKYKRTFANRKVIRKSLIEPLVKKYLRELQEARFSPRYPSSWLKLKNGGEVMSKHVLDVIMSESELIRKFNGLAQVPEKRLIPVFQKLIDCNKSSSSIKKFKEVFALAEKLPNWNTTKSSNVVVLDRFDLNPKLGVLWRKLVASHQQLIGHQMRYAVDSYYRKKWVNPLDKKTALKRILPKGKIRQSLLACLGN